MYAKKGSNLKIIATLLAIALVIGCGIGGTIAWLMDNSDTITNTFTASDLSITLTESKPDNETARMVPGAVITKNPTVTVEKKSEDCYVFVKIDKLNNFDTFMTFSLADGWLPVTGVNGVYYRQVAYNENNDQTFPILANNQVTVKPEITKDQMDNIIESPKLAFTAYAIQSANLTETDIAKIWTMAQPNQAN
jgi:hypothetical protein